MQKKVFKLIFLSTIMTMLLVGGPLLVKQAEAAAPAGWPSSWEPLSVDDGSNCNTGTQFRDVDDTFYNSEYDTDYLFLRMYCFGSTGWPVNGNFDDGGFKWFFDTSDPFNGALTGGNITGFEFLLYVSDNDDDGLGDLLVKNSSEVTIFTGGTATGSTGAGNPQNWMGDDYGFRVNGNYFDMYISLSALSITSTDELQVYWSTDQDNGNWNQAPQCDRPGDIFFSLDADLLLLNKICEPMSPGDTGALAYTITIQNAGPGVAENAVLTDDLPDELLNPTYSYQFGTGPLVAGTWPVDNTLELGTLAVDTFIVEIYGDIASDTTSIGDNTATISSDTADTNASNNSQDCPGSTQLILADLEIDKTCIGVTPGDTGVLAYTITVFNRGPDEATNVSMTDALPAGLSNAEYQINDAGGMISYSSPIDLGTIAMDETVEIDIYADVALGFTAPLNTASVSADQADPDSSDDSDSCYNAIEGADLDVSASCDTVTPGGSNPQSTGSATVENLGPDTATGIELNIPEPVTDPPGAFTNAEYKINDGSWTPISSATIPLADLASGASHTIYFRADVGEELNSVEEGCGDVTSDNDPVDTNDSACCTIGIHVPGIPTLSEWGMIIFSLLLAGSAIWMMRRRRNEI